MTAFCEPRDKESAEHVYTTLLTLLQHSWVKAERAEANGHATRSTACLLSPTVELEFHASELPLGARIFGITTTQDSDTFGK